ncbi:tyrosine-type recombinase/integrase [Lysinibacillus pakistanensis]|uniref:tyrosine-type recombinase/integrase n=1 Tax=Lysinibacillus pakistanensis TaxID=759811 RepID=UPI003D2D1D48
MLLKFAIQEFMDERELMNVSDYTLNTYRSFFKDFSSYLREQDIIDITDVTNATVKSYLMYCKNERNNRPNTINTKLKHIKAFFNFLVENEYVQKNPCFKIQKQVSDTKIEVFTDNHIRQMLRYYRRQTRARKDHEFTAYRNISIIITLLGTGIRIGELNNLKWSDVTESYITVCGKARQQETVPLTEKVYTELMDLKQYYSRYFDDLPVYVFVHRSGEQMSYDSCKGIFKKLQEVMNFKDVRLSAHTFRHTFAHRCIMNGMDVFSLQKILRHKNISITQRYLALWGTALQEQNNKFNPLNNMDI